MSSIEQFEGVVADAGAVAMRVMRGPGGSERLVIQTPGGLITREVPLRGNLDKDLQAAATSAKEIVTSARHLTAPPARNLTSRTISERAAEQSAPPPDRSWRNQRP